MKTNLGHILIKESSAFWKGEPRLKFSELNFDLGMSKLKLSDPKFLLPWTKIKLAESWITEAEAFKNSFSGRKGWRIAFLKSCTGLEVEQVKKSKNTKTSPAWVVQSARRSEADLALSAEIPRSASPLVLVRTLRAIGEV